MHLDAITVLHYFHLLPGQIRQRSQAVGVWAGGDAFFRRRRRRFFLAGAGAAVAAAACGASDGLSAGFGVPRGRRAGRRGRLAVAPRPERERVAGGRDLLREGTAPA